MRTGEAYFNRMPKPFPEKQKPEARAHFTKDGEIRADNPPPKHVRIGDMSVRWNIPVCAIRKAIDGGDLDAVPDDRMGWFVSRNRKYYKWKNRYYSRIESEHKQKVKEYEEAVRDLRRDVREAEMRARRAENERTRIERRLKSVAWRLYCEYGSYRAASRFFSVSHVTLKKWVQNLRIA